MTGGSSDNHAIKGAEQAEAILMALNAYSDKKTVHQPCDELLKDADVMDHCLYNADFPIAEREVFRYNNLLAEFGITSFK